MGRFSQIVLGTRAVRPVKLPLPPSPPLGGVEEAALREVPLVVRVLTSAEQAEVLARAAAYAREKGGEPKEGDPLYDLAYMAHTLVACALDSESPADARVPFFASFEEVMTLDRDRIYYLFEHAQAWQDACSPQQLTMTEQEYVTGVVVAATGTDDLFFFRWRPALRLIFTRTMARQLLSSHEPKSPSTSGSEPITIMSSGAGSTVAEPTVPSSG